jgi:hypothetical protein
MMKELRVRNLSETTSKLYVGATERFAKYYGRSPDQLGTEQVRGFFLHLLNDNKAIANTVWWLPSDLVDDAIKVARFSAYRSIIGRLRSLARWEELGETAS